jgi:hypothetical protein
MLAWLHGKDSRPNVQIKQNSENIGVRLYGKYGPIFPEDADIADGDGL